MHNPETPQDHAVDEAVREFYRGHVPPEPVEQALVERTLGHGAATAPAGRARRLWPLAVAASVIVAGGAGWVLRGTLDGPRAPMIAQAPPTDAPDLVAFRIHADWCPRCPQITPLYTELMQRYGRERVMFLTLDITDKPRREQARMMARTLGIDWVPNKPSAPGVIRLVDRKERRVLSNVIEAGQLPELMAALDDALAGASGS